MKPRIFAFIVWATVAASVMFWGLRLFVGSAPMPAYAVSVGDSSMVVGDVARLLGTTPKEASMATSVAAPVSELSSRLKLAGIMAPKSPSRSNSPQGVALISVDGKPPRAFSVGSRVDGDSRLQAVSLRTASIGSEQGKTAVVLEMPAVTAAATGSLPAVSNFAVGSNSGSAPAVGRASPTQLPATTALSPNQPSSGLVPGSLATMPRGSTFNAPTAGSKNGEGAQSQPAAAPATMQGNQLPLQ